MISRILFFGFFLTTILSFGQNVTIEGVVTDQITNEPIPGVNVVLKKFLGGCTQHLHPLIFHIFGRTALDSVKTKTSNSIHFIVTVRQLDVGGAPSQMMVHLLRCVSTNNRLVRGK